MPHGQDLDDDRTTPSKYECLKCGTIVEAETHPNICDCGGDFQSRANSLE